MSFTEHNPEGLELTRIERAEGWRFLSLEEYDNPPTDTQFNYRGQWETDSPDALRDAVRNNEDWTFRTKAPIPGSGTPERVAAVQSQAEPPPEPPPACPVDSTIRERGVVYGEPHLSHENIGLAWTGMLQQHYGIRLDHPLPAFLVELMMASFKIQRSCRVFHADNYTDNRAYLKFAEHAQANPGVPFNDGGVK